MLEQRCQVCHAGYKAWLQMILPGHSAAVDDSSCGSFQVRSGIKS